MHNRNVIYKSKEILRFYSYSRRTWKELYPSEKWVFEKIVGKDRTLGDILDVGCACGGLAPALAEKFYISSYTGVDINKEAIEWARKQRGLSMPHRFIVGDILNQKLNHKYDLVVSLSCADGSIKTDRIIAACWEKVKKGGYFIISLRLTNKKGINNYKKSYQYINFYGDNKNLEIANYVVFNFKEALVLLRNLTPSPHLIGAYGYDGKPSSTAVTPFNRLVFAVFYIKKGINNSNQSPKVEFNLPLKIFL